MSQTIMSASCYLVLNLVTDPQLLQFVSVNAICSITFSQRRVVIGMCAFLCSRHHTSNTLSLCSTQSLCSMLILEVLRSYISSSSLTRDRLHLTPPPPSLSPAVRSIVWLQTQRELAMERTRGPATLRRDDGHEFRVGRLRHERVRVPRGPDLLDWAVQVMDFHAEREGILEVG